MEKAMRSWHMFGTAMVRFRSHFDIYIEMYKFMVLTNLESGVSINITEYQSTYPTQRHSSHLVTEGRVWLERCEGYGWVR